MSTSELVVCLFVLPLDFGVLFIQPHIGAYFRLRRVALCIPLPTAVNSPLTIKRAQGDVLRYGLGHCKNSHSVSRIPPRVFVSALLVLDVSVGKYQRDAGNNSFPLFVQCEMSVCICEVEQEEWKGIYGILLLLEVVLCKWQKSNQIQKLLFQNLPTKFRQKALILKAH